MLKLKKKICFILARPYGDIAEIIMKTLGTKEFEYYSVFSKVKGTEFLPISPEQFTCISKEVDLVYTNLFHGTIFALKQGANVIALDTFKKYKNKVSKVYDLVNRLGVSNIFFSMVWGNINYDDIIQLSNELLNGEKKVNCQKELDKAKMVIDAYLKEVEAIINEEDR